MSFLLTYRLGPDCESDTIQVTQHGPLNVAVNIARNDLLERHPYVEYLGFAELKQRPQADYQSRRLEQIRRAAA